MYGMIWLTEVADKLGDLELLIMLTSALCHDLDHPGYNNAYQVQYNVKDLSMSVDSQFCYCNVPSLALINRYFHSRSSTE